MAKPTPKSPGLRLRLYIAGRAPNSVQAVANIKAICDQYFASNHDLEIVDVLNHPGRASLDGVIVTPTLVRLRPLPVQKVVGNLSDTDQVVLALTTG